MTITPLVPTMKTHKINPNDIREHLANFTIEYRLRKIPSLGAGSPLYQRHFRLTEIPPTKTLKPRQTVWHEIYSDDLANFRPFRKWIKQCGACFKWNGNQRDFYNLQELLTAKVSKQTS